MSPSLPRSRYGLSVIGESRRSENACPTGSVGNLAGPSSNARTTLLYKGRTGLERVPKVQLNESSLLVTAAMPPGHSWCSIPPALSWCMIYLSAMGRRFQGDESPRDAAAKG